MSGDKSPAGIAGIAKNFTLRGYFSHPTIRKALVVMAALATTLTLWPSIFNVRAIEQFTFFYHIDSDVYRAGALAFLHGENLYTQDYQVGGIQLPFTYPPIAAAVFVPLGIIPSNIAGILLTLLSTVALWWCIAIVLRRTFTSMDTPDSRLLAFLILPIALSTEPVFQTVQFGQVNIFLMTLVLMDTFTKKPWFPRGFWIGLAASIKLTPAVFGLYFLVKKDWKGAAVSVASGVGFSALAFLLAPSSSKIYWTETLSDPTRIGNLSYITNQSMRGTLSRMLHENQGLVEKLWYVAVLACLVGVAVAMWRAVRAGNPLGALLLNSLIALLCSPVSWSHHWVWLIPLALALAASAWNQRHSAPATAATAALLSLMSTVPMFIPAFWNMPYDPEAAPSWPLLLQPAGNSYVVVALIITIVAIFKPGIFGNAPASTKQPAQILAVALGLIVLSLAANIWFKGNMSNETLIQYPLQTLEGRGLTQLGDVLASPLYFANPGVALAVVGLINSMALLWTLWLLVQRFSTFTPHLLIFLGAVVFALISFPVQDALQFGSLTLVSLALICTDFFAPKTLWRRGLLTGIAAGLSGWPILILVGYLIQRRFQPALFAAGTALVLWLLGILANPKSFNLNLYYQWFSGRDGRDNISIFAFVARWISNSQVLMISWFILGLVLGAFAIYRTFSRGELALSQALTIALPALALPTVELHHWVLLLPLLAVLLSERRFVQLYLLLLVYFFAWLPQHLSYGAVFPLNNPAPTGYVAHFGWYLLVEPLALAPASIVLGVFISAELSPKEKSAA
ncbi:glycosyltransferase 87 family protein [Corynebacterium callunae]|uniref:glycosyltransferase 87 family protein n=1 Tax=Corynebacterium callunae TaxID=1721 RepID=UPI003981CA61